MVTITIPGKYDRRLGPNGTRPHFRTISALKSQWKKATWAAVLNSGITALPTPTHYRVEIGLTKRQYAQRGDDDNYAANLANKVTRDQIATMLTGGDDSHWYRSGVDVVLDPENVGFVRMIFEEGEYE